MSSSGRSPAVPTSAERPSSWMSQTPNPPAAKSRTLSSMVSVTSAADSAAPSNRNRRTSGMAQCASSTAWSRAVAGRRTRRSVVRTWSTPARLPTRLPRTAVVGVSHATRVSADDRGLGIGSRTTMAFASWLHNQIFHIPVRRQVMVVGVRRHMPRRRIGHTTTVTIAAERFCLTANQRDDGSLGEVFIHWGKYGTSTAGLASTYALALSVGLQHQVPLAELIRPGLDQFFAPHGHTDDPEIPRVRSAIDYMARRLAIDWLPYPERSALGVYTLTERVHRASAWIIAPGLAGRARQQPGDHHLEEFAHGGQLVGALGQRGGGVHRVRQVLLQLDQQSCQDNDRWSAGEYRGEMMYA